MPFLFSKKANEWINVLLIVIAVLMIPVMLIPKPLLLILAQTRKKNKGYEEIEMMPCMHKRMDRDSGSDEEDHDEPEIVKKKSNGVRSRK
jgi:hypothetical protein